MDKGSVFDMIPGFLKKDQKQLLPKHIAITCEGTLVWIRKNRIIDVSEAFSQKTHVMMDMIRMQAKRAIPILTLLVLGTGKHSTEELESLQRFFSGLKDDPFIHENQIKVSVLGKWYDLPGYLIEELKQAIDETKDYDRYFLNLCMNYSGQEEIVDSCKLIARKIKAGKIEVDDISQEMIKENLYSSYFLPPDVLIKTGERKAWSNLLLWDSADVHYFYSGKLFNDLTSQDFDKAIEDLNKY